jgi:DHA2 family multidrug resistance protein
MSNTMNEATSNNTVSNSPSSKSFMTPQIMLATLALGLGSFMNVLDMTIVNTAVSHIAGDFAVPYSQGTWVITSYAVAEAIMLPLTGWLTNRFGMLKLYVLATLLFTLSSVLCGISPTLGVLLCSRIIQGMVGASMIPLSQSLLISLYPSDKRGLALGIWAMTVVVAPIAGPILGGYLTDATSWRWAFYINVPIGLFSAFMVNSIFKKINWKDVIKKVPVDLVGLICLIISIGSLQLMLDKGSELDWFSSNIILFLSGLSFIFMVIFLIWESHQKNPIVNLKYLKNRNFVIGVLVLCIGSTAFFSTVVILPIWLQNYLGYTAFQSGLTTATTSVFVVLLAPILGGNIHKLDARKVVAFGFIIFFLVSLWASGMTPDVTQTHISFVRLFLGIGLACFFIPINNIMFSDIPDNEIPDASGISNFMRNIGSSFGTSLVVNYWEHMQANYHEQLIASVQVGNNSYTTYIDSISGTVEQKLFLLNQMINSQAALMGINNIMLLSGLIMLGLIPLVFIAKKSHKIVSGAH